jgi:NAD(P)H-dependent flavin oxidoreductase YrpB (nitropropane dioxygenase family)
MLRNDREETDILLSVALAFGARSSGFTRIVNLPSRAGDRARMARLEWTQEIESYTRASRKEKKISKDKERKSQEAQKAAEGTKSSAPSVIKKISETLRRDKKAK